MSQAWNEAGQKRQLKPQGKQQYKSTSKGQNIQANVSSTNNNNSNDRKEKNVSYSNLMGTAGGPKGPTKEVSINDAYIVKDMTRSYELVRSPPEGFQLVLKKMFASLDVCVVNSVEIKGKMLPSLFLHFNESHDKSYDDYDKAAVINAAVQGISLRLTAVGHDKTDAEGTLIPRISKNIHATGVPFSLTRNPEVIKEMLSEWVTFEDSTSQADSIKMVYEDGMYRGAIVIPVAEYTRVPPTVINFPFFTLNSFGSYEKVPNATCKVNLVCKGHNANMRPEQALIFCYNCKKMVTHLAKDCPEPDLRKPLGQR